MSTPEDSDAPPARQCSFCDKDEAAVRKLIAGHSAFICNECVELCLSVVNAPVTEDSVERALARVWAELAAQGKWTAALLSTVLSQLAAQDEPDPNAATRIAAMASLVFNQVRGPRRPVSAADIRCSFCSKTHEQALSMTAGHGGYICSECLGRTLESRAWGDPDYRDAMIERLNAAADKPWPPKLPPDWPL